MFDRDPVTPARVYREGFRWAPVATVMGALAIGVITVLSLFVWHIDGVFQQKTIQRNYANTVSSQSYQTSLLSEMEQHITNITGPGGLESARASVPAGSPEQANLRASELNEIATLCTESASFQPGVAPGSQQMETIVTANCEAGSPVADPPLANPVPAGGQ